MGRNPYRNPRQMGIGSVPDAALSQLTNHKNLGIHTEMFSASWLKTWDFTNKNGKVMGI